MPRAVLIFHPRSRFEQNEELFGRSLASLADPCGFSFRLVLIETRRYRFDRDRLRKALMSDEDGRDWPKFVEMENDDHASVIEATNKALRFGADAKLDAIIVGPDVILDREALLELCSVSGGIP